MLDLATALLLAVALETPAETAARCEHVWEHPPSLRYTDERGRERTCPPPPAEEPEASSGRWTCEDFLKAGEGLPARCQPRSVRIEELCGKPHINFVTPDGTQYRCEKSDGRWMLFTYPARFPLD